MAKIVGYTKLGNPIWEGRDDGYVVTGEAYTPCGYLPKPTEENLQMEELNG